MLRRFFAALLLLPCSFVFYHRSWWREALAGPWCFFARLVKEAPLTIRKRKLAFNLFVYYPMRMALDLLHGMPIKQVFIKIIRRVFLIINENTATPLADFVLASPTLPFLPLQTFINIASQDSVKVVSFDIFDTLFTRPVIDRYKDLFYFIEVKIQEKYPNLDFAKIRWTAEEELDDSYATLADIYKFMQNKHRWSEELTNYCLQIELETEKELLYPRQDAVAIYQAIARTGKRIIATSDMYLPADFLLELVHSKGFTAIAKVYVSCELKAHKSKGKLFDLVLEAEGLEAGQMLHLGDNPLSDHKMALARGIPALQLESLITMVDKSGGLFGNALRTQTRQAPFWGAVMAHSLELIMAQRDQAPLRLEYIKDIKSFAKLLLGPLLLVLCLRLRKEAMKLGVKCIYFASRDGYLPLQAYNIIRQTLGGPEGIYLQAGRRSYLPFLYESFLDYAKHLKIVDNLERYTLKDFIAGHLDADAPEILNSLSQEEKDLIFCVDHRQCLAVLERFADKLAEIMSRRKQRAQKYYQQMFATTDSNEPIVVFDIGYSGSIGQALKKISGRQVIKIYCWELPENAVQDRKHGTKTIILMGPGAFTPYNLILEELFAPFAGGCIDFTESGEPIQETLPDNQAMQHDLEQIQIGVQEYLQSASIRFASYLPYLAKADPQAIVPLFHLFLNQVLWGNRRLLENIVFPDPVYCDEELSLESKLDRRLPWQTVFHGTGFEDRDHDILADEEEFLGSLSARALGIHFHIYNLSLAQEFLVYLAQFPADFDLYLTTDSEEKRRALLILFQTINIPKLKNLEILIIQNRGRDIAPWLIATAKYQQQYDLFCHLHAKESDHIGFGEQWRNYLFSNLLRKEAFLRISACFDRDLKLGCLFPDIYTPLRQGMTDVGMPLYGSEAEYKMITGLLKRMSLSSQYSRREIFFSAGSMLWYRPVALKPLFECGLEFTEFPEEPIGVGGTLAHALERIPPLVAKRVGFSVRTLTVYPSVLFVQYNKDVIE